MESEYSLKEYGRWLCERDDKNEGDVSNEWRVLTRGEGGISHQEWDRGREKLLRQVMEVMCKGELMHIGRSIETTAGRYV